MPKKYGLGATARPNPKKPHIEIGTDTPGNRQYGLTGRVKNPGASGAEPAQDRFMRKGTPVEARYHKGSSKVGEAIGTGMQALEMGMERVLGKRKPAKAAPAPAPMNPHSYKQKVKRVDDLFRKTNKKAGSGR